MLSKSFKRQKSPASRLLKSSSLAIAITLASCASTPLQLPTQTDIDTAQQNGTLEALFSDLSLRAKLDPNAAKLSKQIGGMIADDKLAMATEQLNAARIEGVVPVAVLNSKTALITAINKFSASKAQSLKDTLASENQKTQNYIKQANSVLASKESSISEQLTAAVSVASLRGEDPTATEDTLLSNAYNTANNLEVNGDFETASMKWQQLFDAAPDYRDVQQRLEAVSGTYQLDKFNTFLAQGDVDGASQMFVDLASRGVDLTDFAEGYQQLVSYYQLEVEAALEEERLAAAVESANTIKTLDRAAGVNYVNESVTTVVEALILRGETYSAMDKVGLSLGVLLAADSLSPNDPLVLEMLGNTQEILLDKSITRLSLGNFSGTEQYPQIGNRISSLIKEKLIAEKLDSIKLIERDKLQAVFVEKELLAMKGGEVNTTVEPADIVVQGEVLSARVDENRSSKRKTKRVVVEVKRTPNPAYQEWLGWSDSKKRKNPKPVEFFEENIKEDVKINSEVVRVEGFLSASYRLINPVTATIMSYQSLEKTANYEGENVEGIEIGLFVQEGTVADVPGTGQIMSDLSQQVAGAVAVALTERFADPIGLFLGEANTYLEKADETNAALSLGKAYSYASNIGASSEDARIELQRLALKSEAYLEE